MGKNLFSIPIFFIVFRETLEAAIIVSVLLGLVEQIVHQDPSFAPGAVPPSINEKASAEKSPATSAEPAAVANGSDGNSSEGAVPELPAEGEAPQADTKRVLRKMRIYIFAGAFLGLFLALAIGAAFIAVWFTQASNLWAKSEELWEGALVVVLRSYSPPNFISPFASQVSSSSSRRSSSSSWAFPCSRWTARRLNGASSSSAPLPDTVGYPSQHLPAYHTLTRRRIQRQEAHGLANTCSLFSP